MSFSRWLRVLWSGVAFTRGPKQTPRRPRRRRGVLLLHVEILEERALPSVMVFPSEDVPKRIPQTGTRGALVSTLRVPASFPIQDLDVQLDIDHTYDGDLAVALVAPDGRRVELFAEVGDDGANFRDTILDDEAATPIAGAQAPFAGRFRPQGLLSALDGADVEGVWQLVITDRFLGDFGLLNRWSLFVEPAEPANEVEPNNDRAHAGPILLNVSTLGRINADDVDVFTFPVSVPGRLTLRATPGAGSALDPRLARIAHRVFEKRASRTI